MAQQGLTVTERHETIADVLVAGAGATGLVAAAALRRLGLRVALIGRPDVQRNGRTLALLDGSVRLLQSLEVFPQLLPHAAALRKIRIIDATGTLFRAPLVEFAAAEIGLRAFGWNIENADLVKQLCRAINDERIDDQVAGFAFERTRVRVTCGTGHIISTRLVIAADGRQSPAREAAGIGFREWQYPQLGLTAILQHRLPHDDTSTEFYTREGPFTLVPLPASSAPRSSLVWLMQPAKARRLTGLTPELVAQAIERQAQSMLGNMVLDSPTALAPMRGICVERLTAPRLALVGEAAHVFPPIGAQGLNLGLRDVAHLVDCIAESSGDPGSAGVLRAYERRRRPDIASRSFAVDLLNRTLLTDFAPMDAARGAALIALSSIGPLRRSLMREGIMPSGHVPSLMRA
jgi:2-octaprenyl-6-methoxyphenol hydroxylase